MHLEERRLAQVSRLSKPAQPLREGLKVYAQFLPSCAQFIDQVAFLVSSFIPQPPSKEALHQHCSSKQINKNGPV
jgi:hypothetical protein